MEDFKKALSEGQIAVIEAYEEALKQAPYELKKLVQDILTVQKNIARKLGYRPEVETNNSAPPPKDYFKSAIKNNGQVPISTIENKNINKDLFKKSDELPSDETIENDNINTDAFEPNEEVEKKLKSKVNPKRISQHQKEQIEKLANEGLNAKEISDKLLIIQAKVVTVLSKMKQGKGNLIATNATNAKTIENEKYTKE